MSITLVSLSVLLSIGIFSVDGAVYRSPNADDPVYWREYGENHLKKILKSQKIKGVNVAKNVIYFVGDGMSFATIAAGRILKGQNEQKSGEESEFSFESFPHMGLSKTYNLDKQVPDSAGTATALFTGIKANYGVICLNPATIESSPSDRLRTVFDWAQKANKRTGLVTNTRITHATPASTYSYAFSRNYECDTNVPEALRLKYKDIARQLVEEKPGRDLNVIFGGGRDFLGASIKEEEPKYKFSGGASKSCNRTDKQNLVEKYLKNFNNKTNVKYVTNTGEMVGLDYDEVDNVMGLFSNNHMSFQSLRNKGSDGEPSLSEMTKAAIKVLDNKKNKNGWILVVEGGRIDQAHHQNLARLALEEMVEFNNAIENAIEMTDDETLIIVTADHSHAMIFNGYPERGSDILGTGNKPGVPPYETLVYATGPGYYSHVLGNSSNASFIPIENFTDEQRAEPTYMHSSLIPMEDAAHAGEDVGVFATGPGSNLFEGTFEQSFIAHVISYSSCIGPLAHKNPACRGEKFSNASGIMKNNFVTLISLNVLCFVYRKLLL